MATFRSEFNSVPNTYNSDRNTTAFKKLTTCFRQWLQQLLKQQKQQRTSGQFSKIFVPANNNDKCSRLGEKKNYLRKLRKLFKTSESSADKIQSKRQWLEDLQVRSYKIVNTFLSSTLISSHSATKNTMTILDTTYMRIRDDYPDIDVEIRGILLAHAQNGATISRIKSDYRNIMGLDFPVHDNITDFLLTIPGVTAECCETGKRLFNVKPKEETRHLQEMIIQQRQRTSSSSNSNSTDEQPPRLWRSRYSKRFKPNYNNINNNFNLLEKPPADKIAHAVQAATPANCYYQDNCKHLNNQYQLTEKQLTKLCEMYAAAPMLPAQPLASVDEFMQKPQHDFMPTPTTLSCQSQHESMFTMNSDYDAYLLDFPLLGDDFLLYLARMELKCHFRKFKQVLQSGLCVSGQTINAAKARIEHVDLPEMTQIIVNIGSEDILRGKALVQIQHDFRQLIKEMHNRRFVPVLTTLAPLANYCHSHQICDKVDRFNKFIRSEGKHLRVIDIHSCLINENNIVRFDCYQNGPRSVTGSPEPYVFWNKIGRQRVLQMIEDNLEYNF